MLPEATTARLGQWKGRMMTVGGIEGVKLPMFGTGRGIQVWTPDNGPPKRNIEVPLGEEESNWVRRIEDTIQDQLVARSDEIFGNQDIVKAKVQNMWNSNLRGGCLRVKLDTCDFFDNKNTSIEVPPSELLAYRRMVVKVDVTHVYFMNKKIGLVWKAVEAKVSPPDPKTHEVDQQMGVQVPMFIE